MTVLVPGLDDEDQRVKISSLDDSQQGILDSFKSKVGTLTHSTASRFSALIDTPIVLLSRVWIMWSSFTTKLPCGTMKRNHMC